MSVSQPPKSAARTSRQVAIRRRQFGAAVVVGVAVLAIFAYALRPSENGPPTNSVGVSPIEAAAAAAAKNAQLGVDAADAVERRAWSIGPYARLVPISDGIKGGVEAGNLVALTFDDGPGAETWDVLALLKRYKMHATFFVNGQNVANNPDALAAIAADGHVVGNHTWTHASLPSLNKAGLRREIDDTSTLIVEQTGHVPTIMRPPFGDFTGKTNQFVRSRGLLPIMWTIDSDDWQLSNPQTIATNVLNSPALKPGAVILLHDGSANRSATVDALLMILDGLTARGLRSVTIPELLRAGKPSIARPGDYTMSDYATG